MLAQPKAIVVIEPCEGIHHLVIQLPYSSGLRRIEGQRLQVKMSILPNRKF